MAEGQHGGEGWFLAHIPEDLIDVADPLIVFLSVKRPSIRTVVLVGPDVGLPEATT